MSVFESSEQPEINNPLEHLVGEGKKFKSVEDLAKGKMESDQYIEQLHAETKELREELKARMSVEEALKKVREKEAEVTSQDTTEERQGSELPDIDSLLNQKLQDYTAQQKAEANLEKCDRAMRDKFGERAKDEMSRIAKEQGLSLEFVKTTAMQSPSAFMALMGLNQTQRQQVPGASADGDVNTSAFGSNNNALEKRLNELKEMRRTNRRAYLSPKVQKEVYELQLKMMNQ